MTPEICMLCLVLINSVLFNFLCALVSWKWCLEKDHVALLFQVYCMPKAAVNPAYLQQWPLFGQLHRDFPQQRASHRLCLPVAGGALLGQHAGAQDHAQVLGLQVAAHAECLLPRGDHILPAGHSGRQVLPAHQLAVPGAGWGPGHQEHLQVSWGTSGVDRSDWLLGEVVADCCRAEPNVALMFFSTW